MSATSDNAKNLRRRELKAARAALPAQEREEADAGIARQVTALPEYARAGLVLPYLSFGTEVDTRAIIRDAWSQGKEVALPRCIPGTRDMAWYRVESFDGLVTSSLGVDEPVDDPAFAVDPAQYPDALVLVPGMEFDRAGYRLGYGGGFYDVFLSTFKGVSVGLCRDQFLQEGPLAHDAHDLPADIVATQTQVLR